LVRTSFAPGLAAFLAAGAVALLGLNAAAEPERAAPPPSGTVHLRLLGLNDLHGHLEPPRTGIGGVAWLKAHFDRHTLPGRTIRVHAGDMVGASPLLSSWFHDEPAIEAMGAIGFDVGTLGNHEFDEGGEELLRLLRGGRRSGPDALKRDAEGRLVNTSDPGFAGVPFTTIAANTFDRDGRLLLPPFSVVERAGVRVGFIGVTTAGTPRWLLRRYAEPFNFGDVSDAVNRWVPVLRARGVEAIVVLAHEGAPAQTAEDPHGPVVAEAREMHDAVDVVVAGHSHSMLNLRVPNPSGRGTKLVVEALSYGTAFDLVDLAIDRASGEIVQASARVPGTVHDEVQPDAALGELVAARRRRVAPLAERVLGQLPRPLTRAGGELAQIAAEAQREHAGADLALVSPASLRADVDAGPVTYEELFAAQAYDHPLLRLRVGGADLAELLRSAGGGVVRSAGVGPLQADAEYSVVASELLVDRLPGLRAQGGAPQRIGTEVEALSAYVDRRLR
jgi:5'-nucleotidase